MHAPLAGPLLFGGGEQGHASGVLWVLAFCGCWRALLHMSRTRARAMHSCCWALYLDD